MIHKDEISRFKDGSVEWPEEERVGAISWSSQHASLLEEPTAQLRG